MKKQNKNTMVKLSEKYDKQLLNILSEELQLLKEAKNTLIKRLNSGSGGGLQVA